MINAKRFVRSTKDFKKLLLFALALIVAVSIGYLVITSASGSDLAYAASTDIQDTDNWDTYTDSDYIGASGLTISQYPSLLYNTVGAKFKYIQHELLCSTYELTVADDDPIVSIVPKECFRERGEHLHIGREYGFYVKTQADAYFNGIDKTESQYNNTVDVMVFDIETSDDLDVTIDRIIVKVEPLFQYRYGYIDSRESIVSIDGQITDPIAVAEYVLPSNTDRVFAMPKSSIGKLTFEQTWNYYLKDISYGVSLYNVQEKNTFNEGYVASEDNGSFVTQSDYKYDGIIKNNEQPDYDFSSEIISIMGFSFGMLSLIATPISELLGAFSLFLSAVSAVDSFANIVDGLSNQPPAYISASNGTVSATDMYSTKAGQLSHYVDEDGTPKLIKIVKAVFPKDNDGCNVWYGQNNSASFYVKIADTPQDGKHWYTGYERMIGLRIVDKDGIDQNVETESSYGYKLYEPIYKELELDEREEIYVLPQDYGYYTFTPKYTSDYFVSFDTTCEMEVYYQASGSDEWIQTDMYWMYWNYYPCRFTADNNRKYRIKAKFKEGGRSSVLIEPGDGSDTFAIDANSDYLVKCYISSGFMASVWASNKNLLINKVFYKTDSNTFTEYTGSDFTEYNSVDLFLQGKRTYYFLIKNPLNREVETYVEIASNMMQLRDGENTEKTFIGGAPTKYFGYTVGDESCDVMFLFDGAERNASLRYSVIDWNGNPVATNGFKAYNDGCVEVRNMQAKKKYYIGISAPEDVVVKPTVKTSDVSFVWKMKQNGEWKDVNELTGINYQNGTLFLDRGQTYEFGLWVYGYMAKFYSVPNNTYVTGLDFDIYTANRIGITNDRRDGTSFTLAATHDIGSDMIYNELLRIVPMFVPGEVKYGKTDYENKMALYFDAPSDVVSISGWLQIDGSARPSNDTDLYQQVVTASNGVYSIDFLYDLCMARAKEANFVVERIRVKSGDSSSGFRDIAVSKSYMLNCDYAYHDTIYYLKNELHLFNQLRETLANVTALGNDIELNTFSNWPHIEKYVGMMFGNEFKIKNLKINNITAGGNYGLVGINEGYFAGLYLENVSIDSGSNIITTPQWTHVGAIAGVNKGTINNCTVTGRINVKIDYGAVGGIAGSNDKSILSCKFGSADSARSEITACGDTGGIVGSSYAKVLSCKVINANVNHYALASSRSVGGVVGYGNRCTLEESGIDGVNVFNVNTSTIGTQIKMGMLVGCMIDSTITSCFRIGDASANRYDISHLSNKTYCFNGADDWKFFGQLQNCTVDGKTGQYGP